MRYICLLSIHHVHVNSNPFWICTHFEVYRFDVRLGYVVLIWPFLFVEYSMIVNSLKTCTSFPFDLFKCRCFFFFVLFFTVVCFSELWTWIMPLSSCQFVFSPTPSLYGMQISLTLRCKTFCPASAQRNLTAVFNWTKPGVVVRAPAVQKKKKKKGA